MNELTDTDNKYQLSSYPNKWYWDSMLTVRLPEVQTKDEARTIIQTEIIRPLSSLLKDKYGHCKIAAWGCFAKQRHSGWFDTETWHHAHLLILSNVGLPTIDCDQDPAEYRHMRRQLIGRHGRIADLSAGKNVIHLAPIRSQSDSLEYINKHFALSQTEELCFGAKILNKIIQQQAA